MCQFLWYSEIFFSENKIDEEFYDENTEAKFQQTWTYWVVGCWGLKVSNILVITDVISPSRNTQKSSQHACACATGDGAICSKNRKIVPYHGDSPNSRISARLRSPSPIMAPASEASTDKVGYINDPSKSKCWKLFCQPPVNEVLIVISIGVRTLSDLGEGGGGAIPECVIVEIGKQTHSNCTKNKLVHNLPSGGKFFVGV